MPDTISTYSQVRIAIQLPAKGPRVPWSANLTSVKKGVPTALSLASGHVDVNADFGTPEALHEAIGLVARELQSHYPLIVPEE